FRPAFRIPARPCERYRTAPWWRCCASARARWWGRPCCARRFSRALKTKFFNEPWYVFQSAGAALPRLIDEPVPIRPGHTIVRDDGLQHPGRKALSLQLTRMIGRRLAQHHSREPSLSEHGEKRAFIPPVHVGEPGGD